MKFLFFSISLFITIITFSQSQSSKSDTISYKLKGLPDFKVYKAPDSTAFSNTEVKKRKPVLLMLFSPECGHCQHVATEVIENMDSFKKAEILMITWLPFQDMVTFYKDYKIANYPHIIMAYDSKYFFVPYYHVSSYPKLIVYNKQGKYVKEFEGDIKIDEVWKAMYSE